MQAPGGNTIGGTVSEARNIISGNGQYGIRLFFGATVSPVPGGGVIPGETGNIVAGNYIGTDVTGANSLPNQRAGITIDEYAGNIIGGAIAGQANVISGNVGEGILIQNGSFNLARYNLIQGNFIGTLEDGLTPLGNGSHGISILGLAADNQLGGTVAGMGNILAFNNGNGVNIQSATRTSIRGNSIANNIGKGVNVANGIGNTIQRNTIFVNTGLGIDLGTAGVTLNDTGDGDTGANNLLNFPVLTSAVCANGTTTIAGTYNSLPGITFTLDFYANANSDPSNYGEGERYLGSTTVTTDGSGNADFSVPFPIALAAGQFVSATATDPGGSTSEFAQCRVVENVAAAPRVGGIAVNAGQTNAAQRSRVTSIAVTFSAQVTFAGAVANAFGLSRIGGGAVGGFTASASVVNNVTVVTLTGFTGAETEFGSLADGRFSVLVRANQVSANGLALDGDGNGTGGDDYTLAGTVANGLYRLYGDANGDGVINAVDFGQFRGAFGTASGDSGYRDFLDLDGDGQINAFDFAQFRTRFGSGVP